jgi:hypothetical protein
VAKFSTKFHGVQQNSMTKLHGQTYNIRMWVTKYALFIWANLTILASTSIFVFKWHILNLMNEEWRKEGKNGKKKN